MQVTKTNLSETNFKLNVVADIAFLDKVKIASLRHMSQAHLKIPGFRAGKVPLALVEKQVDQNKLQQEFLESAVNKLYVRAVKAENLKTVANPEITIKKFVPYTQLEFDAEVEAVGEIKLPNYKTIKVAAPKVEVTASDIKSVIDGLKKRLSDRTEVSRDSKNGDELTFDFKGTDLKGETVNGASGTDYPLIIGSNTFIPGFEPNLVGLKPGQEKTFSVTFPKDYGVKTLQSKKVNFWVNVKKVSELKEPKLDDAFAAKAGPFKTVAELKADIKKQLKAERELEAKNDYENRLVTAIADKAEVKIPKILIDDQVERSEQAERQNLTYKGQTWQEHLNDEGVTEQQHRDRQRPDAEKNVKAGLVLSEIADKEKIEVTPEELEVRIQLLKGQYSDKTMQEELDNPDNRRDIANRLLTEKTINRLKDYSSK